MHGHLKAASTALPVTFFWGEPLPFRLPLGDLPQGHQLLGGSCLPRKLLVERTGGNSIPAGRRCRGREEGDREKAEEREERREGQGKEKGETGEGEGRDRGRTRETERGEKGGMERKSDSCYCKITQSTQLK